MLYFFFKINTAFLGGIFNSEDAIQDLAFRYAVESINKDRNILVRSKLEAVSELLQHDDSFHASKRGNFKS